MEVYKRNWGVAIEGLRKRAMDARHCGATGVRDLKAIALCKSHLLVSKISSGLGCDVVATGRVTHKSGHHEYLEPAIGMACAQ